jgi:hypothetical protein
MAQIEWISKEEAGVLLGTIGRPLSSRRVLELAKEGRIESGRVRDPNNGQTVVRIHAGSIERYLERKRNPEPIPSPRGGSQDEPGMRQLREPHTSRGWKQLVNLLRDGYADRMPAWLTLNQAADYSGLPAGMLRDFICHGKLRALDVGIRRGGRWRVRRMDLDLIEGNLLMLPEA